MWFFGRKKSKMVIPPVTIQIPMPVSVSKPEYEDGLTIQIPMPVSVSKPEYEDGHIKEYPSFTAKVINKIETKPGCWNYLDVGVFQQDASGQEPFQIGTYRRNYHVFFDTFSVTRKGDKYYALYSPNYTGTRVLEITPGVGIKDIGGEEKDGCGFCPTDLYIPTLREYVSENYSTGPSGKIKDWSKLLDYFPAGSRISNLSSSKKGFRKKIEYEDGRDVRAYYGKKPNDYKSVWGPIRQYASGFVILPPKHAFVSGCYWGDDSSWKIQYIDVSRIDEGIIVRDERFGYIELPPKLTLKQAINVRDLDTSESAFKMSIEVDFDINSGGIIDWNVLKEQIEKGQVIVDRMYESVGEWKDKSAEFDVEMRQRWDGPEGEAIRKMIEETGGEIR